MLYDIQKTYDGTPISYAPNDYWIKQIPKGYTLEFALEGSQTETGEFNVKNLYNLPYVIRNERGEDVTENFYLKIEGTGLRVNRRIIHISSASAKMEYNGQELTDDTVTITLGTLVEGHELICEVTGSITEVGIATNTIEGHKIVDQNEKDCTDFYEVKYVHGTLEITKGPVV